MWNIQVERLKRLPQREDETWQGGLVRLVWVKGEDGKPVRPWTALWVGDIGKLASPAEPFLPQEKDPSKALLALVNLAEDQKLTGYRPGRLEVSDPALADYLRDILPEAGIEVTLRDKMPVFGRVYSELLAALLGTGKTLPPDPLSVPGVTVERMRAFAQAAAVYYEARLWHHITDEDLIQIESPAPPDRALRWLNILGASGITRGLSFFDSPEQFKRFFSVGHPSEFYATDSIWALTYNPITEIPVGDSEIWEDHELPTAGETAYPFLYKPHPKTRFHRAAPHVLSFVEGLLRALAQTTEDQIDAGRWTRSVITFDGPRDYTFCIPDLLKPMEFETGKKAAGGRPLLDRRMIDREMVDIQRILAEREFKNLDEVNAYLAEHVSGKPIPHKEAQTPLEQAQELVYLAFESRGRRRVQLARKALAICPDCADAYVLLAEQTGDPAAAMDYYRKAVAAGERALGERYFAEEVSHFWGLIETRPYMRARQGLAESLYKAGSRDEAIGHFRDLLRLNPGDNQGIRYLLLPRLLEMNQNDEAERLMRDFTDDPMALWAYGRALLAFRKAGDSPAATQALQDAQKLNPKVIPYLRGQRPGYIKETNAYQPGGDEEAILCAQELSDAWNATPGAMAWLENVTKK